MRKILLTIAFIQLCFLTACESEALMNIEQPNYYAKLAMKGCLRIVAINGFEIESDFNGDSSAAEIPINHIIKNGENYVELMVEDQQEVEESWGPNTRCSVEIRVSGNVSGDPVDYKVADIVFSGDYTLPSSNQYKNSMSSGSYMFKDGKTLPKENGEDSILADIELFKGYETGMEGGLRRNFIANVPFPRWAFFDAEELFKGLHPAKNKEDYHTAKKVIWPKVLELWDLFESKDINKILPLFEMRSAEYDQAFYREPGNTLSQLKNSLENVYNKNYPLNRKDNEKMQMLVSYANNLVTVVNAATYNGTVMFYDHVTDSNTFYTVYWMKKDGKWIIAR